MRNLSKLYFNAIPFLKFFACIGENSENIGEMEGFIHPVDMQGQVEEAQIDFILRDFDTLKLIEYGLFIVNKWI